MERRLLESFADRCGMEAADRATLVASVERLAALVERYDIGAELRAVLVGGIGGDPTQGETLVDLVTSPGEPPAPPVRGERYEHGAWLGGGGMGVVHRVVDPVLRRTVAMKVLRAEIMDDAAASARFVAEAQINAQLQHPGIVPVHDLGLLADGRPYFTMKEVQGRTLADVIGEVHDASVDAWRPGRSGWTLYRLIGAFQAVCNALSYAHSRGVVHRDLKPQNVMLGAFGEALVLDWGLAKALGRADPDPQPRPEPIQTDRPAAMATRPGQVSGTPEFMPPEQAAGEIDAIDARADVYALGAILYTILSGRPPYTGESTPAVLRQVLQGPPPPPGRARGPEAPQELVDICLKAMARAPGDRYPSAAELSANVLAWLEGAKARQRALATVVAADAARAEIGPIRARARELAAEAEAMLAPLAPWAPEQVKAEGWRLADEAAALRRDADMRESAHQQSLQAALYLSPDLDEAHARLAEHHLARHRRAEARGDTDEAARQEPLVRAHDRQGRYAAYLRGDGALTLLTDPPGAEVLLFRYEVHHRRLVERFERSLGRTPLRAIPLPMGSYLCVLREEGRADVRYPVHIGRQEHVDGVPPGGSEPLPIALPRSDQLPRGACYVPAGWFWSGGGPASLAPLPQRRLWCPAVVFERFPITNRQYIAFLDALVEEGREEEALRHAPQERPAQGEAGAQIYGRDEAGRFVLQADADGDLWVPDWPVFQVDWYGARAYAAWRSQQEERPWRLPGELEWEKAARGVDRRLFPWGNHIDPSWCHNTESHRPPVGPTVVDSYPVDCSVYGVRGMSGNIRDWCADLFCADGPPAPGGLIPEQPELGDVASPALRVLRGGSWDSGLRAAHAADRGRSQPTSRGVTCGFRLAASWPWPS